MTQLFAPLYNNSTETNVFFEYFWRIENIFIYTLALPALHGHLVGAALQSINPLLQQTLAAPPTLFSMA